jgi:Domain of unknown function (DUF4157)
MSDHKTADQTKQQQGTKPAHTVSARTPQAGMRQTGLRQAMADPLSAPPDAMLALQRLTGNRAIQRLLGSAKSLQRRPAIGLEGGDVDATLQSQIEGARGGGKPLDAAVGSHVGGALGADFSGVRVHTDSQSDSLNRSLSAKAFTHGSDIFFSQGTYAPGTGSGRQLLVHELTHVVQQGGDGKPNKVQTKLTVGAAGDKYEQEADRVASQVMRQGISAPPAPANTANHPEEETGGTVARQVAPSIGAPSGVIQRAVGFEFQTKWGLVRNLPDTHVPHNNGRAQDPDVEDQNDWEDEQLNHPVTQAPVIPPPAPQLTKWQKTRRWFKKKWRQVTGQAPLAPLGGQAPPINPNAPQHISNTQWQPDQASTLAVTRPGANRAHYKFFKSQVLKDYNGFKMTVDDASTPLGAELEWVVDPPVQESNNVSVLEGIMDRLKTEVDLMVAFKDRESFTLDEVSGDNGDSHIEVQPKIKSANNMEGQAQATGGVGMDQLLTMFKDVGGVGQSSGPEATAAKDEIGGMGSGSAAKAARVGSQVQGSSRLKGLVAYIYRYLSMGAFVPGKTAQTFNAAAPYAKNATLFLARTDFNKMFSMLPQNELTLYGGQAYGGDNGNVDAFVTLIENAIIASGSTINFDRPVFERGIQGPNGTIRNPINVDCRSWIRQIADGNGDLLGSKFQKSLNSVQGNATAGELESMGNLGNKTDKVGGDGNQLNDEKSGVIMEFRGVTKQRDPDDWKDYATTVFKYLKALNNRQR